MAYRSARRGRGSFASRRTTARASTGRRRSAAGRRSVGRKAAGNTLRIVVEQVPASAVSRGFVEAPKLPPKKAKL